MNNWGTTGGVDQFVAWSPTASVHQHFFTDAGCRAMYRASVAAVINRINSISGRRCLLIAAPSAYMHALRCPGEHVENDLVVQEVVWLIDSASVLHSCTGTVTIPQSLVRPPQGDMLHNVHSHCMHVCLCKHSKSERASTC